MIVGEIGLSLYIFNEKEVYGGFVLVLKENWLIVVILDKLEFLLELDFLKIFIVIYLLIFLIIGIFIIYFIVYKLFKRIKYLLEFLNILFIGDFISEVNEEYLNYNDEIGDIIKLMYIM